MTGKRPELRIVAVDEKPPAPLPPIVRALEALRELPNADDALAIVDFVLARLSTRELARVRRMVESRLELGASAEESES